MNEDEEILKLGHKSCPAFRVRVEPLVRP